MIESWKEFQYEYNENRPSEPYCSNENAEDWANIARYAEENLEKAFEVGFELASRRFRNKVQQYCDDIHLSMNWDEDPFDYD